MSKIERFIQLDNSLRVLKSNSIITTAIFDPVRCPVTLIIINVKYISAVTTS